jgi:hypothetical protein
MIFLYLKFNYFFLLILKAICASITCSNGGTCIVLSSGVGWTCVCQPGYTGDRCQQIIGGEFLNKI